jgi:hypothetical protein
VKNRLLALASKLHPDFLRRLLPEQLPGFSPESQPWNEVWFLYGTLLTFSAKQKARTFLKSGLFGVYG